MCLVHKEKARCCKSQISMKCCFTNHLFFWRLILVSDETCYGTSLGTWRDSWHLQQKIRYPEHPNLIWFLFSSLFQDIIKGNTFTNYNTTFNFSMTHIFKLVKPQFFLFSSGWEKSLLSHMQQWDLKSISEKKKRMEENWSSLFILNINY